MPAPRTDEPRRWMWVLGRPGRHRLGCLATAVRCTISDYRCRLHLRSVTYGGLEVACQPARLPRRTIMARSTTFHRGGTGSNSGKFHCQLCVSKGDAPIDGTPSWARVLLAQHVELPLPWHDIKVSITPHRRPPSLTPALVDTDAGPAPLLPSADGHAQRPHWANPSFIRAPADGLQHHRPQGWSALRSWRRGLGEWDRMNQGVVCT